MSGALPALQAADAATLREAALHESQRVLRARAQLDVLDAVAREHQRPLCVLKGGAAAGGEDAVDLVDLDVLLDERDVPELAAALRRRGFAVQDPHTQGDPAVSSRGPLPVELHVVSELKVALLDGDALQRSRPLPMRAALTSLAPPDQLWNLLCHVAQSHLNRQGNIRDMLLISAAGTACTSDELRVVEDRVAEHPYTASLRASLAFALSLVGGGPEPDPFERIAGVNYLLGVRNVRRAPTGVARPDLNPVFALLSRGPERRLVWRRPWLHAPPSSRAWLRRLRRRAPRVERVTRGLAGCVRLAAALVLAALAPALVLAARLTPGSRPAGGPRARRFATS